MKTEFDRREAHDENDTLPEQANVYVPPRRVAPLSDHRTMDVKAIRIAAELDPRQALTELRLMPPPRRHAWGRTLASVFLLAALGVATYFAFLGENPLVRLTTEVFPSGTSTNPGMTPAPTAIDVALPVQPAATPAEEARGPRDSVQVSGTAALRPIDESERSGAATATATETPVAAPAARPVSESSAPALDSAPRAGAASASSQAGPRRSKARQEPWLE